MLDCSKSTCALLVLLFYVPEISLLSSKVKNVKLPHPEGNEASLPPAPGCGFSVHLVFNSSSLLPVLTPDYWHCPRSNTSNMAATGASWYVFMLVMRWTRTRKKPCVVSLFFFLVSVHLQRITSMNTSKSRRLLSETVSCSCCLKELKLELFCSNTAHNVTMSRNTSC